VAPVLGLLHESLLLGSPVAVHVVGHGLHDCRGDERGA
jgi:hypothetical protein